MAGLRHAIRTAPDALRHSTATFDSQCLPKDFPKHCAALDHLIDVYDKMAIREGYR